MMQILEYQMLDARNLLCCTTKLDRDSLAKTLQEINEQLENNGVFKKDTTMYLVFSDNENPVIYLHVSTKKNITHLNESFWMKERIFLVQAVKARHEGELYELEERFSQITQYLVTRKLSPITPFCCKVLTGLKNPQDTRDMIVDIYVGVNGNIV